MKKNNVITLIAIALASICQTSCIMYHPHNVDLPLLQERGDLRIEGSISASLPTLAGTSANLSVAYAVLPNVGVTAYGTLGDMQNRYGQLGAGTFWPLTPHTVLEAYVGYGGGYSYHTNTRTTGVKRVVEGPYSLMFTQLDYGWAGIADETMDVAFGIKSGLLNSHWTNNLYDTTGVAMNDPETLERPFFLLEPQVQFRVGGPHLKFSINMAYAVIFDWPTDNEFFNYERLSISAGINYRF